jgi:hypothetical protein
MGNRNNGGTDLPLLDLAVGEGTLFADSTPTDRKAHSWPLPLCFLCSILLLHRIVTACLLRNQGRTTARSVSKLALQEAERIVKQEVEQSGWGEDALRAHPKRPCFSSLWG